MNFILNFVFLLAAGVSSLQSPEKIELILRSQEAVFNCRWAAADSIITELSRLDAADPAGLLFRAAALQAEMTDREENLYGNRFLALCDSVKSLAEKKLANCSSRDSALCYLYIGHQDAYRSLWESRFRSNFSAVKLGMKAKGACQNGLKADSTLYDLYVGLGTYHYWKSVKSGILRSAGLFKDEREKGIDEIETTVDSSLFSKDAARSALIWIMIDRKDYDSALVLAQSLHKKYPEGKTFLWPQAEAYFKSGRFEEAAQVYSRLRLSLLEEPGNYYNLIECSYQLHKALTEIGDKDNMKNVINDIRANYENIPRETKRVQKQKLGYLLKQED